MCERQGFKVNMESFFQKMPDTTNTPLVTNSATKASETTKSPPTFPWPILGKYNLSEHDPEFAKQLCELHCDSMDGEKGCLFFHLKKEKVSINKPA